MNRLKIKKGDTVKIIAGKDKGKTGTVVRTLPSRHRIAVEGINIYKKHVRARSENEKGQIVEVARPIHISNVQLVCPSCTKTTRIGIKVEGKEKTRYCKHCNATL